MSKHDTDTLIRHLDDLAQGYQWSQVLFRAVEADLFSHTQDWNEPVSVAHAVGWDTRAARMMLDALASQELLLKEAGRYRNTPATAQCLVPGAPDDQTHILMHKAYGWDTWGQLDNALQSGEAVPPDSQQRSGDELRAFICGMADIGRQSARRMLELLDLSPYTKLLDLGAGPGIYSIAFCRANPAMQATAMDREEVLSITREQVEAAGLADRIRLQPGDLTRDSFGAGYDLILLSNIIHSFSEAQNRALVQRCAEALDAGGMLIVKDFLVDADATEPAFSFLFALHMLVHTGEGDVYTTEQVAAWAREAGFAAKGESLKTEIHPLGAHSRLCCITKT